LDVRYDIVAGSAYCTADGYNLILHSSEYMSTCIYLHPPFALFYFSRYGF